MSETVTGFADQALESARAFRHLLDAMAQPGRIFPLAGLASPTPLLPTSATIALTLCDYDTPLWLDDSLRLPQVIDYLRFHTGAPIVEDISAASFLFCTAASAASVLRAAHRGTAEYPDNSATLIIQLGQFPVDAYLTLKGPGIDGARTFSTCGLPPRFWDLMADNHTLFPLGVDAFFATPAEIAALPRSTQIRREGIG